jgi:hypothetical protein
MKRLLLGLSVMALAACGDFSTTIRPTALTLTPDRTSAQTGQDFEFRYDAQGRSLAGLIIDYGDGGLDSIGLQGAVTATGGRVHAYETPGTYVVTGRLEEFLGGVVNAEVTVSVTGASP